MDDARSPYARLTGWTLAGSAIWLMLAFLQLRIALEDRTILPVLLAVEGGLIAYRLILRHADRAVTTPLHTRIIIWGSVFLPFFFQIHSQAPSIMTVISCMGVVLSIWGLFSLGASFGIAPADRGLVSRGPYRYIRHPMYSGALLTATAAVFGTMKLSDLDLASAWNLLILALLLASVIYRIRLEEANISGYDDYTEQVRWRLFPGIW